jgi:hypothetical protein
MYYKLYEKTVRIAMIENGLYIMIPVMHYYNASPFSCGNQEMNDSNKTKLPLLSTEDQTGKLYQLSRDQYLRCHQ